LYIIGTLVASYFAVQSGAREALRPEDIDFPTLFIGGLLAVIIAGLATIWSSAALTRGVSDSYLGKPTSVGEAYRIVGSRVLTLLLAGILIGIIVGIGLIIFIIPGLIFLCWFSLSTQAIVIENLSATNGMSRSKALISGNALKALGLIILLFIFQFFINWIIQKIDYAVIGAMKGNVQNRILVINLINVIVEILIAPILAIPWILLYYDMRIRKEGFDLEMLARSMGVTEGGGNVPPVGRY